MAKAAVPQYLGQNFNETPPGHRFTLYGAFWEPDKDWQRVKNIDPADLKQDFDRLPLDVGKLRDKLRERQCHIAQTLGNVVLTLEAQSIAPFVTGTGIEHPLENGMAFLNPYGLPYLPGSSVKGVLRRAAEELRDDVFGEGGKGWDPPAIDALFGKEPKSVDTEDKHTRGTLIFWDAFPKCDRLAVDIMNPHYGDYYQGKTTPHDSGQPIPIYFLTIPPKSQFTFHVQCNTAALPESLRECWQDLLQAAFEHAFDWLGFGAKTAVGYGQMERDQQAEEAHRQAAKEVEQAALPAEQRKLTELRGWLEEDKASNLKEPGGRLANRLNELLKEGENWPVEFKIELADLGNDIYDYLGWGKKKQERKAKIQALRAAKP